ncbi:MAG: SPFH domain-containing protein [Bacteroidia bacterium]
MKNWLFYALIGIGLFAACHKQNTPKSNILLDQVNAHVLEKVRLGDGVPLDLQVSVRWHIENIENFTNNYGSPARFDSLVLSPRQFEIVSQVSNTFEDVDQVFTKERDTYIDAVKEALSAELGEDGITIKEVIVSQIKFPMAYTEAKEKIGMQEQKLALIENEKLLAIENAKAQEEKAKAEGEVRKAKAVMEGDVAEITAETEKLRRLQTLAKAETEAQVTKLRASADAERNKIMAGAEADRLRQLASVDIDKQKQLKEQELLKEKEMNALAIAKEKDLAKMCADNPQYASFLISKELASKVSIAVLPSDDGGIFNTMLNQQIATTTGGK